MAVPGVLKTYSFRMTFEGQSIALRSFLNRIVNSSLPYAIRDVKVRLANESGSKSELESLAENPFAADDFDGLNRAVATVPIISDNSSRFEVTLEFLELEEVIAEPAVASQEDRRHGDV